MNVLADICRTDQVVSVVRLVKVAHLCVLWMRPNPASGILKQKAYIKQ